jgi:hypothetical protein
VSFICGLFNETVSSAECIALGDWEDECITNWKGYGRKWSWPNLRYYLRIFLEGLRKTIKKPVTIASF